MHPLVQRLIADLGWPLIADTEALEAALATPRPLCLFLPGDASRNLETPDAAVILPELRQAFQNRFACAVVAPAFEDTVRERFRVLKTPAFAFFEAGRPLGDIQKVRDWDDYLARTAHILGSATQPAA